ncbi:MAG TPA: hypothetical protein VFJ62_02945, partial [Usitatibacter sp.]|nr:hypothetical protein [Usitatibacter sp.]
MLQRSASVMVAAVFAAPMGACAGIWPEAASPLIQSGKRIVTSADQLPRRAYAIPKLPSDMLSVPKAELDPVLDPLDRDAAHDLETLDIRDRAARAGLLNARAQVAIHRGRYAEAQAFIRQIRSEQEKAAEKLTSGVSLEKLLEARTGGGTIGEQRERFRAALAAAYGAMPWAVVGDVLKSTKATLELLSRDVTIGGVRTTLDPAASNLHLEVPTATVVTIVSARNSLEHLLPFRDDAVAILQDLVDRNRVAKADVWTGRLVTLPAGGAGEPVVVGIWDSGTDVALFAAAPLEGIAFDDEMRPAQALVRPMGAAQSRMGTLKQYMKGAMDLQAAIDSPDARALKQRIASLGQEEV